MTNKEATNSFRQSICAANVMMMVMMMFVMWSHPKTLQYIMSDSLT